MIGWMLIGAAAFLLFSRKRTAPAPALPPSQPTARILAPQVAQDIADRGASYDKDLVRAFQAAAGIVVDGLYGNQTAEALVAAGIPDPPPPLYGWRS